MIDATVTYAKTDKCPLIHSSKLIVVEDYCRIFTRELEKLAHKQIYIYNGNIDELKMKLYEVYGRRITNDSREKLQKISESIKNLKHKFNLTDFQGFVIEYFINFLDLNERINFIDELLKTSNREDFNFVHKFVSLVYHCHECRRNFEEV